MSEFGKRIRFGQQYHLLTLICLLAFPRAISSQTAFDLVLAYNANLLTMQT